MIEDCKNMETRRVDCAQDFYHINEHMDNTEKSFKSIYEAGHSADIKIAKLETTMISLVESMHGLTKSIWGAVISLLLVSLGFFIWYIEKL